MRRREFIMLISGAVAAMPIRARAQRSTPAVIGVLSPEGPKTGDVNGLVHGLRELGYVEGRNFRFEYRWAEGKFDRLSELAADLVRLRGDLIVAFVTQATEPAKNQTSTIPIGMVGVSEPVGAGLAASLVHPGGNVEPTWLVAAHMSAFDPKRTLGVHSGKGFDTGFTTYQSTRFSRPQCGPFPFFEIATAPADRAEAGSARQAACCPCRLPSATASGHRSLSRGRDVSSRHWDRRCVRRIPWHRSPSDTTPCSLCVRRCRRCASGKPPQWDRCCSPPGKGQRFALPNVRILVHQPKGGFEGQATDNHAARPGDSESQETTQRDLQKAYRPAAAEDRRCAGARLFYDGGNGQGFRLGRQGNR